MAASAWLARLLGMYLDKAFSGCPLFLIIYMISEDIYQNYYLKINMLIDWLAIQNRMTFAHWHNEIAFESLH